VKDAGYKNQLMVMQASGGVMTVDYIEGSPIRVLASGPAGGVVGSAHVGAAKGYPDILCVDMGGTSYDISVVSNGAAPAEAGWNMHHRYLIGVPMVKVETLGAGAAPSATSIMARWKLDRHRPVRIRARSAMGAAAPSRR